MVHAFPSSLERNQKNPGWASRLIAYNKNTSKTEEHCLSIFSHLVLYLEDKKKKEWQDIFFCSSHKHWSHSLRLEGRCLCLCICLCLCQRRWRWLERWRRPKEKARIKKRSRKKETSNTSRYCLRGRDTRMEETVDDTTRRIRLMT